MNVNSFESFLSKTYNALIDLYKDEVRESLHIELSTGIDKPLMFCLVRKSLAHILHIQSHMNFFHNITSR